MVFGFDAPLGLFALASVIPLIILYLIKPKPTNLAIPSLMFFIKHSKISKKNKILRHFQNELLFYVQLLTLVFLALVIAQPYLSRVRDLSSENKLFVVDVSASAQVREGEKTRFDLAAEKVREFANLNHNTLVLAKNMPLVALEDVSRSELLGYLRTLKPSDEETNLGDAMLLAGERVSGKGRVIVLSDFIHTKNLAPERAKNALEGKGIAVDMISTVVAKRVNIGIVNLVVGDALTTVYVKNYAEDVRDVPVKVNGAALTTLTIKPGNIETYSFPTVNGVAEITLEITDDFSVDNVAYANTPDDRTIRVLYVSNAPSKFVQSALATYDYVKYTLAQPPIIPKEPYDVYVLQNVNTGTLLPGTFEDIAKNVREKGSAAIVHVQENSEFIDYKDLTVYKIANRSRGGEIVIDQNNRFTKDVDFGIVKNIYQGELAPRSIFLASVNTTPVVALREEGSGKVVHYGILERESEFKISPDYPVFWIRLLKYLKGQKEISDINLRAGAVFFDEKGNQLILDKIGTYDLPGGRVAVNLLNEKESDINPQEQLGEMIAKYELAPVQDTDRTSFMLVLLVLILGLVVFESVYLKIRGEI